MGIDIHALQLLQYNKETNGALGKTLTLGRQAVLLGSKRARKWAGTGQGAWCEDLLMQHFAASEVDSIDNSAYEGAKIIFDYNYAIPQELCNQYDSVLDFGCSEHIFDVTQVFRNTSGLCKEGGRILHILPADNFCGHGFYQFVPEFFFSIYSKDNGFVETEIYLSELLNHHEWYRVQNPQPGQRINIRSSSEILIIVSTRKVSKRNIAAQQSDYTHTWNQNRSSQILPHRPGKLMNMKELLSFSPFLMKRLVWVNNLFAVQGSKKLGSHPGLARFTPPKI